jgi:Zn-dependent protease with chaperone function
MAIKYLSKSFMGFQEYTQKTSTSGMFGADSTPLYAHPIDGWILSTLNAGPVKAVMNKAMDAVISFQFGHDLAQGAPIDQKSFPEIFQVLSNCATTLNIPTPYAVAQHDPSLFNAHTAGTEDYAFINISSALLQYFTKEQASFVIGHECGHIAANHAMYQTLVETLTHGVSPYLGPIGDLVRTTAGIPLFAWSRRAEITADRAGLLCCGDIAIAEKALLRLVTGLADVNQVDIESYLDRSRSVHDFHQFGAWFQELIASHPMIPKRIEALRLFADSQLYYSLSGKTPSSTKSLLTQEELNQRVNQIVKP